MARNGQYDRTWLYIARIAVNGCKYLKMAVNGCEWLEWIEWLEMAGIGWTWLKFARISKDGWKWPVHFCDTFCYTLFKHL